MNTHNADSAIVECAGVASKSCSRVVRAVAVALLSGAAWCVAGSVDTPQVEAPVRLAAVAVIAEQGQCGPNLTLMKVSETLRMIAPPTSARDVEDADDNGDHFICVKMPRGAGKATHFEDNWYKKSGGGGGGGCKKPDMSGGNGDSGMGKCGNNMDPEGDKGDTSETGTGHSDHEDEVEEAEVEEAPGPAIAP